MHCTHGCVLSRRGTYELDPHGCPEVVAFGLRKAHRKACKHAPAGEGAGGARGRRARGGRAARRKALDRVELATYAVVWSMVMFGALPITSGSCCAGPPGFFSSFRVSLQ